MVFGFQGQSSAVRVHDKAVKRQPPRHWNSHLSPRSQIFVNNVGSKTLAGFYPSIQPDGVLFYLRGTLQLNERLEEYCPASQQLL